mgnify:FL=1
MTKHAEKSSPTKVLLHIINHCKIPTKEETFIRQHISDNGSPNQLNLDPLTQADKNGLHYQFEHVMQRLTLLHLIGIMKIRSLKSLKKFLQTQPQEIIEFTGSVVSSSTVYNWDDPRS